MINKMACTPVYLPQPSIINTINTINVLNIIKNKIYYYIYINILK